MRELYTRIKRALELSRSKRDTELLCCSIIHRNRTNYRVELVRNKVRKGILLEIITADSNVLLGCLMVSVSGAGRLCPSEGNPFCLLGKDLRIIR